MKVRRGKRSEAFWPSIVMKKWLNIQPKNNDFSEDEIDTETESEDDVCSLKDDKTYFSKEHARRTKGNMSECSSQTSNGTWNVAGRLPKEDLDIDEWLCMQEPADIYILGFQEVVPLNAGNVLGAETRMPITKWEAIIRKSLNKSPEPEPIPKSYSAPTSPVSEIVSHADLMSSKTTTDSQRRFYSLDWPEYALDVKQDVCVLGKNLRRVLSSSDRVRNDWFTNPTDFGPRGNVVNHGELKRERRSSGDLGLLLTQQQERADVVGSLYDVFEQGSEDEEDDDSFIDTTDVENKPIQSGNPFQKYVRIMSKQMGSISVSMSLYQTRFCFVCAHLTSGHKDGDYERRNSDVFEILRRTCFSSVLDPDQPQTIPSHDSRIFWFGDLNYRINMADAEVRKLVAVKQWDKLLFKDQLCKELGSGRVFEGWKEGVIDFPPTYKYEVNSDRYVGENPKEGEKRRTPAWCDRILWLGKGIKQLSYSKVDLRMSDHKPVSSVFSVKVEVFDPRKLRRALNLTSAAAAAAAIHPEIIIDDEQDFDV
ncbi:type I inositol polyphosphate 5-phosphatase 2-like protein isoform X1 [Tanacetum coccineum]